MCYLHLLLFVQSLWSRCCGMFWGKLSLTSPPQLSVLQSVAPCFTALGLQQHDMNVKQPKKLTSLLLTNAQHLSVFPFYVCKYSNRCVCLSLRLIRFTVTFSASLQVERFLRALAAQQLQCWKCHSPSGRGQSSSFTSPNEMWCSLDTQQSLNLGWLIVCRPKETSDAAHVNICHFFPRMFCVTLRHRCHVCLSDTFLFCQRRKTS